MTERATPLQLGFYRQRPLTVEFSDLDLSARNSGYGMGVSNFFAKGVFFCQLSIFLIPIPSHGSSMAIAPQDRHMIAPSPLAHE